MTIVGLGVDVVDLDRFRAVLDRRPRIERRLFSDTERGSAAGRPVTTERLAARFAAKEAVMKALGVGLGAFGFRDVEVVSSGRGRPQLTLRGRAAEVAGAAGVSRWHLSMTHHGSVAVAVAVAEAS